jgi:transposase
MSRDIKYIGMDVHKEATVIAVLNGSGKLMMESIVETKASSILQFIHGLRGELHVTWEEGTWAAWLYDLLLPQVAQVLVCDPRHNAFLKEGNKSDKIDARKLADLLRTGMLRPVYHGEHGLRTLRELGRSYQTISQDLNRVMNRIKARYRGWSIPCAGTQVYAPRYREEWLQKIEHAGVRRRAELLYQQLDGLQALRRTLRPELLTESRKHKASKLLRQIPCIGPIRAARLLALMQTPHRFRSKRQLWTYSGLGIETRDSAQYRFVRGQLQRAKKPQQIRGLNRNHNHEMKEIFKASRDPSQLWGGSIARVLCGIAGQGNEARDGAPDVSAKDRGHCFDTLEEGGTFRGRTTEATSSLSVAQNAGDLQGFHASVVAHRFCDARVRGRVSMRSLGTSCAAACSTQSPGQSYAPSHNPKKP